jgi:DNA-binding transcriptional LysR family regulator
MDTTWFQDFLAVLEEGGFTRAAERRAVSQSVEALAPMTGTVQLTADSMVGCEKLMIEGRAHFLLCHDHPAVATRLTPDSFRSIEIGQDVLAPVATPHLLETCKPDSLPYLAYTADSQSGVSWLQLGRPLDSIRPGSRPSRRLWWVWSPQWPATGVVCLGHH